MLHHREPKSLLASSCKNYPTASCPHSKVRILANAQQFGLSRSHRNSRDVSRTEVIFISHTGKQTLTGVLGPLTEKLQSWDPNPGRVPESFTLPTVPQCREVGGRGAWRSEHLGLHVAD